MIKKTFIVFTITSLFLIAGYASASNVVNQNDTYFENGLPQDVSTFIADIFVDDDADPSWYDETHVKTIIEGITNASKGDTIFVYNGTYFEIVKINKSVDLIGESNNSTIIDGKNTVNNVLSIYVDFVNISGFTIQNSTWDLLMETAGIRIYSNYTTIENNIFTKNLKGVEINNLPCFDYLCRNNNVINNLFLNNNVILFGSYNGNVSGNYFINEKNSRDDGLSLHHSSNNLISENSFTGEFDTVIYLQSSNNNTIKNNNIKGSIFDGIWLIESNKNEIHHNNIEDNFRGIALRGSNCNKIHHNNFKKCLIKATFVRSSFNRWHHNYWGRPRILPKIIFGTKGIIGLIPWFNFDLFPAKKPYEINI